MAYAPSVNWDLELGVAEQRYEEVITTLTAGLPNVVGSLPFTTFRRYSTHPVDVFVTRRFAAEKRLSPYVRLGARYVEAPSDPQAPPQVVDPGLGVLPVTRVHYSNRTSAQAGAGVRLRLTPRTALRVEVGRLFRSETAVFDPLTRMAAGLSWHF